MAYTKKQQQAIVKSIKTAIKTHRIKFFYQVFGYVPCCQETGTQILKKLGELVAVKDLINTQRTMAKVTAMNRWEDSENATLQMGFFKLLANDDELERLNNSKQKTEVIIKDDRTEAEILRNIKGLENTANDEDYDITKD